MCSDTGSQLSLQLRQMLGPWLLVAVTVSEFGILHTSMGFYQRPMTAAAWLAAIFLLDCLAQQRSLKLMFVSVHLLDPNLTSTMVKTMDERQTISQHYS